MNLQHLRRRIDEIDEELVKLLSERFKIVKEIAKYKVLISQPILDHEREEHVKQHWQLLARNYDVPLEVVHDVISSILKLSKIAQVREKVEKWRDSLNVLILGSGRMARTFEKHLKLLELKVKVSSWRGKEWLNETDKYNIIMLTTRPDSIYSEEFKQLLDKLKQDTILVDVFSSKSNIFHYIENECLVRQINYISTHPLFGPLDYPVGETIIIIPSKSCKASALKLIEELFKDLGFKVKLLQSIDEHEKAMAVVQVIHHIHLLNLMLSLHRASKLFNIDFREFSTYSLKLTSKVLNRIRELINVILEIQLSNKYAGNARAIVRDILSELTQCIENAKNVETALRCVSDTS